MFKIKGAKQRRTSKIIRGRIWCRGGVSILCWSSTAAVWSLVWSGKTEKSIANYISDLVWSNDKYGKRQTTCDPLEDLKCICWQSRCIGHRTFKVLVFKLNYLNMTVHVPLSSLGFSKLKSLFCLYFANMFRVLNIHVLQLYILKRFLKKPHKYIRRCYGYKWMK